MKLLVTLPVMSHPVSVIWFHISGVGKHIATYNTSKGSHITISNLCHIT